MRVSKLTNELVLLVIVASTMTLFVTSTVAERVLTPLKDNWVTNISSSISYLRS